MNKDLYFEGVEEFTDYIVGRIEDDGDLFVSVVGKFDTIKSLLKEVMFYENVNFESIEIESETLDDYADEFVLSLWLNGELLEFGCEKAKRDGKYISFCGDETYLLEDCSSKIMASCEESDFYFVNFDTECDYDKCERNEECCCGFCDCGDDNVYGFVVDNENDHGYSKFSYYSSTPVNKSDIRDILRKFGF